MKRLHGSDGLVPIHIPLVIFNTIGKIVQKVLTVFLHAELDDGPSNSCYFILPSATIVIFLKFVLQIFSFFSNQILTVFFWPIDSCQQLHHFKISPFLQLRQKDLEVRGQRLAESSDNSQHYYIFLAECLRSSIATKANCRMPTASSNAFVE